MTMVWAHNIWIMILDPNILEKLAFISEQFEEYEEIDLPN